MAPPEPPLTIHLKVKVPPGHLQNGNDEFVLGSLPVSSNIAAVRQLIQQVMPSHPTPERQRILYGGRALVDNEQTLAHALNTRRDPSQTDYVLHLVIKGDGTNQSPASMPTRSLEGGRSSPLAADGRSTSQGQAQPQPQLVPAPHAAFAQHQHALPGPRAGPFGFGQPGQLPPHAAVPLPHQLPQFMLGHPHPLQQFHNIVPGVQQAPQQQQQVADGTNGAMQPNGQPAGTTQDPQQTQNPNLRSQGMVVDGVGPDGRRFQIHHQQTFNVHHAVHQGRPGVLPQHGQGQIPGLHLPGLIGQIPLPVGTMPPPPPQGPQTHVASALDRARENMVEMRRMLDEVRNAENITQEQRARITNVQDRARSANNYIDPFNLGDQPSNNTQSTAGHPQPHIGLTLSPHPPFGQQVTNIQSQRPPQTSSDVTCYLLSSPQGPHALLMSRQHGTYTGISASSPAQTTRPTATATTPSSNAVAVAHNGQAANAQQNAGAAPANQLDQNGQAAQANGELGALQPLLGHFWLLFRVLIFAWFLLGGNMGWRRPLALLVIGLGFWLVRMGMFGDGGVARRWWDGIMAVPRREGQGRPNAAQGQGQAQAHEGEQRNRMPTPEELAQRLLNERNANRDPRLQRLREMIRPVERVVALLMASLWPGIGEAHVRAIEEEERRQQEEEVAARRREEEERAKKEEEEKKEKEGESSKDVISTDEEKSVQQTSEASQSLTSGEEKISSA